MKNLFLFLLFTCISFGQTKGLYTVVDATMDKIPSDLSETTSGIAEYINTSFKSENDKVRAAFYWTASNIRYDIENLESIDYKEISQDKIKNTVINKRGVCIHYAEVFNDICFKIGIKAYIIYGYSKQNGKIDTLSHAWCAAKIDGTWWLFDPTWGAGHVDKGKFVKRINNTHYKVIPDQFIANHFPFDYLWQFLKYPVSYQEFVNGQTQINKTKPNFDFVNEISNYDKLSDLEQAKQTLVRIEKYGLKNDLYWFNKKHEIESIQNNAAVDKLRVISDDYNQAIGMFNDFINYRNKQFKPLLPDEAIKSMIQTPKDIIVDCQTRIYGIGYYSSENVANVKALKKSIGEVLSQIEVQEKFVTSYLSKSKGERKGMFTRITWFGIPVK